MNEFNTNPDPALDETIKDAVIDALHPEIRKHVKNYRKNQKKIQQENQKAIHHSQKIAAQTRTEQAIVYTNNNIEELKKALEKEKAEKEEHIKKENNWKIAGIIIGVISIILTIVAFI